MLKIINKIKTPVHTTYLLLVDAALSMSDC